jgi:uncharacterized protein
VDQQIGDPLKIEIPQAALAEFCRRNQIHRLALFGSALRQDFRPDSDVDLLVVFEPDAQIGFMELGRMRRELSDLFNRRVDLVLERGLKPLIRQQVLESARTLYAA